MIFCFVYKQTLDLSVVNNFLKYAKFGIDTHNIYIYILNQSLLRMENTRTKMDLRGYSNKSPKDR